MLQRLLDLLRLAEERRELLARTLHDRERGFERLVLVRPRGLEPQREKRARAKPRARLELDEHEQRRDDRIRHVRSQVHFHAVQAEQPADYPAEQKMKAIKRQATDEQPRRSRMPRVHAPPFGAQIVKVCRNAFIGANTTVIVPPLSVMITPGTHVSRDLAYSEALPLLPVPPRWVESCSAAPHLAARVTAESKFARWARRRMRPRASPMQ